MNFFKLTIFSVVLMVSINTFGHGTMATTYPENGSMLMAQPKRLEMHFQSPMRIVSLRVAGSNNNPVAIILDRNGEASKDFKVKLPNLKPDTYTVNWKAIGGDGHPMKGSYRFTQH
jgi:methionine-rich copper-binding protein CopC